MGTRTCWSFLFYYLALWAGSIVISLTFLAARVPSREFPPLAIVASAFGPWAGFAATVFGLPNKGEFDTLEALLLAAGYTFVLVLLAAVSMRVVKPWLRNLTAGFAIPLLLFWPFIGCLMLMSRLE